MEVRQAIDQAAAKKFDTKQLRDNFLVEGLFEPGQLNLTYTYYDRLVVGGATPDKELQLEVDKHAIGADFFLERREMTAINIGGRGSVIVDGEAYELDFQDCLYIGKGSRDIRFTSASSSDRAKFYLNSAPAHKEYPIVKLSRADSEPVHLGSAEQSNTRTIYKYIHPAGVPSCQLVTGVTLLEPNNIWNTMPVHLHDRRMEAYLYFNIPEGEMVFHFMGEPEETRHIIVRNEQVVLSPSWSIHSGVGTSNYSFIWGMAGENQEFTDMDGIEMKDLK